jgi:hypothetical protein
VGGLAKVTQGPFSFGNAVQLDESKNQVIIDGTLVLSVNNFSILKSNIKKMITALASTKYQTKRNKSLSNEILLNV